ncbi:hypothetical protein SAY86_012327 [Trapa natans]|uniref:Uncharacterized protein n=1 Tax=Trapa natans TaxID=22666 RepID=A0AAN7MCF5_TRANT|nr:hypothetical protein SAY86_012327 [Trapa natans]
MPTYKVLAVPNEEQCNSMGGAGGIDLQRAREFSMRVCFQLWHYRDMRHLGHIVVDPRGHPLLIYCIWWLPPHLDYGSSSSSP